MIPDPVLPVIPRILLVLAWGLSSHVDAAPAEGGPSAAEYESIQAALDDNPGRQVFVPSGEYRINVKLRISGTGSGLYGPGRIVQLNSEQPLIVVKNSEDVVL